MPLPSAEPGCAGDSHARGSSSDAEGTDSANDANDTVRIHAVVTGLVQGVEYRYFAVTAARRLGVTGWVRNLRNGDVELEAQGRRTDIAALISRLKTGPRWSRVDHVAVTAIPLQGETTFRVYA